MPTTDYSKNIIYKIVCEGECYVGHTTNFINRKCQHKSNSKKREGKLYQFIRDKEWTMTPIEEFPCENKTQACIREDYWIQELEPSLNSNFAVLNKQKIAEYREQHKEQIAEYHKEYYKNNKELFAENMKQYQEQHKEQISEYQKKYREQHKDYQTEYQKQYYEQNKEQINIKIECECGAIISNNNKYRHEKTSKHLRLMEAKL